MHSSVTLTRHLLCGGVCVHVGFGHFKACYNDLSLIVSNLFCFYPF